MVKVSRHNVSMDGYSGIMLWFLMTAFVLCVLGFFTPAWYTHSASSQEGLWQSCSCNFHGDQSDWFRGVQAMMALGAISLLIALIMAVIYQFCHCCPLNCNVIAIGIFAALAVVGNIIGLTLYGLKYKDKYGTKFYYSFYLEAIGTGFALVSPIFALIQYCKSN